MLNNLEYKNKPNFGSKIKIFDNTIDISAKQKRQLKTLTKSIKKKEIQLINNKTASSEDKFVSKVKNTPVQEKEKYEREDDVMPFSQESCYNPIFETFRSFDNPITWFMEIFMR